MFLVYMNNVTGTLTDACSKAPSSCAAKKANNAGIVAGIAVAVPVISVLMSMERVLIVCLGMLLLNAIAIVMRTHGCIKKRNQNRLCLKEQGTYKRVDDCGFAFFSKVVFYILSITWCFKEKNYD